MSTASGSAVAVFYELELLESALTYVCLFIVDRRRDLVLLVRKTKGPPAVVGKLNGIGGKVNPGESSQAAARRECLEECGLALPFHQPRVILQGTGWSVHFYLEDLPVHVSYTDVPSENDVGEAMQFFPLSDLSRLDVVPNVQWLLPFCLDDQVMPITVVDVT